MVTGKPTNGAGDRSQPVPRSDSQRWNWFLAVDYRGTWIVVNGIADVQFTEAAIEAVLYVSSELPPYHVVAMTFGSERTVEATVSSPGPDRPQPFKLTGTAYLGKDAEAGESRSILLSDGTTVLGLAFGPNSGRPNP